MTRHPTTQDMRRLIASLTSEPKQGSKPLTNRERAVQEKTLGALQQGEQRESKPRVPLIGVDCGAIPGTRPDHRW